MSFPLQQYAPNNGALVEQHLNRAMFNGGNVIGGGGDLFGTLSGLVNQLMAELLRTGPDMNGMSPMIGSDLNNPQVKVFGVSSMNVTQISRGPDGRPHIIQTHDERRMGPGGVWQTKKALRDPERGIEKMQLGYFDGDRGQIIERRLDPSSGQYHEEVQRHEYAPQASSFPQQWPMQPQQSIMQKSPLPYQQYQHYFQQQQQQQQQQQSFYAQQRPAALPPYVQQRPSVLSSYAQPRLQHHSPYAQQPMQALPAPPSY